MQKRRLNKNLINITGSFMFHAALLIIVCHLFIFFFATVVQFYFKYY